MANAELGIYIRKLLALHVYGTLGERVGKENRIF